MTSVQDLVRRVNELQADFLNHVRQPTSPFHKDITRIRLALRDAYERVIFLDQELAASKDYEAAIFKVAHYRVIEEFRKRHKQITASKVTKGRSGEASEARRELRDLTSAFRSFLTEATGFYLNFMSKLTERFHLEKVRRVLSQPLENIGMKFEAQIGNGGSPRINADAQSRALYTCQRSLIYLGDLARYREMYSEPKEKNYSLAKTFYNLALRLMPENGNPFNQLAVIDTYESDDLLAVEHYFRSLTVTTPFLTAQENLSLVFQKSRKRMETGEKKDLNSKAVSTFARDFIYLHANLFAKDRSLQAYAAAKQPVVDSFRLLLQSRTFESTTLMKLLSINMSSIYLQMHPEKANLFQPTPELEHELVNLMMDMLGICLHVALERRNRLEGEDAETIKKAVQEILPAVKVGMRWMVGASAHKERWNTILGHFDLWVALSNFLTALGPLADVEPMHSSPITLDEDLDFQGFLPFGEPSQELDSVEGDLVSDGTLGDAVDLRIIQIIRLGLNMAERKISPLHMESKKNVNGSLTFVFYLSERSNPSLAITPNGLGHAAAAATLFAIQRPVAAESFSHPNQHPHPLSVNRDMAAIDMSFPAPSPQLPMEGYGHAFGSKLFMNPEVYPVNTSDRAYNDEVNGDVIGPNEVPGDTLNTLAFLGLGTPPADDWMTNNIPKLNGGKAHLLEGDFGGDVIERPFSNRRTSPQEFLWGPAFAAENTQPFGVVRPASNFAPISWNNYPVAELRRDAHQKFFEDYHTGQTASIWR